MQPFPKEMRRDAGENIIQGQLDFVRGLFSLSRSNPSFRRTVPGATAVGPAWGDHLTERTRRKPFAQTGMRCPGRAAGHRNGAASRGLRQRVSRLNRMFDARFLADPPAVLAFG
jgi:hypothetical protein